MPPKLHVMNLRDAFVFGGPDATLMGWLPRIDTSRFRVSLTCFDNPGNVARVLLDPAERAGIETFMVPWGRKRLLASVTQLSALLRRESVDVLHTHDWKADLVGYLAARRCGIPVMTTVYVWFGKNSLPKVRAFEWLDRQLIRHFDLVTAISEATRRDTVRLGIPSAKARAVFSGVDLDRFSKPVDVAALRSSLGIGEGDQVVGYLDRLYPEKAHSVLVEAAKLVLARRPNVKFLFVGGGPLAGELQQQAQSLGIGAHLILAGVRTDVPDLLRIFDVQSHASLAEGIPLALYEGMAASRPVVGSDVDGIPEVVKHELTGLLVKPRDPSGLAAALLELLIDRDKAMRLGAAGRRLMEERYSLPKVVSELEQMYLEVHGRSVSVAGSSRSSMERI
ncbi:MAG TPA: glycosyltransferase [Vicinamibacterales bacterium]|nr:glycosyltransferase [Vicinamibacterales bacterium]